MANSLAIFKMKLNIYPSNWSFNSGYRYLYHRKCFIGIQGLLFLLFVCRCCYCRCYFNRHCLFLSYLIFPWKVLCASSSLILSLLCKKHFTHSCCRWKWCSSVYEPILYVSKVQQASYFCILNTTSPKKKTYVSVVHTCLMAHSKEHVNVLTAVWSISFLCTHTHTYTRAWIFFSASSGSSPPWCCCWQHDKTAFHVSLCVYRISRSITALARRVTLSQSKYIKTEEWSRR